MIPPLKFTADDAERAYEVWGANCGPAAIAAICGLSLDQVRPHMGDFERKRYTNPTLMVAALQSVGAKFSMTKLGERIAGAKCTFVGLPWFGLARIQWEGPWTASSAPPKWRYRHTHWIGAADRGDSVGIFDVNALGNGTGWGRFEDWRDVIVPHILKTCVPRADGKWHVTHAIEVEQ